MRVLDVDVLESGNPYMVMEYLEGENLHVILHTPSPLAPPEPLSIGEGVDHVVQSLAALGEAHAAGIVHRDLKPANVFVTKGAGGTAVVKVLDFGVSKMGASGETGTGGGQPLTKTGAVIGTVAYMAPEQMLDAKRVDARADLWSVAIILHELLTRTTPFGPQNGANLVATMLRKPPVTLSSLRPDAPAALDAIVARCLEKDAAKRYPTASAVASALAPFSTPRARGALDTLRRVGEPTGQAAPAPKDPAAALASASERQARRVWTIVMLVGAAVAFLLLGVLAGVLIARPRWGASALVSARGRGGGRAPRPGRRPRRSRRGGR